MASYNNHIPDNDLFATIKVVKKPKLVEYLIVDEVDGPRTTEHTSPRLRKVADIGKIIEADQAHKDEVGQWYIN